MSYQRKTGANNYANNRNEKDKIMAIVQTMTETTFTHEFKRVRPDNFTPEALRLIYGFYEDLSNGNDTDIEFDPIAICCEYSEETPEEIAASYDIELSDPQDRDLVMEEVREYLEDHSFVVGIVSDRIVYQQF